MVVLVSILAAEVYHPGRGELSGQRGVVLVFRRSIIIFFRLHRGLKVDAGVAEGTVEQGECLVILTVVLIQSRENIDLTHKGRIPVAGRNLRHHLTPALGMAMSKFKQMAAGSF